MNANGLKRNGLAQFVWRESLRDHRSIVSQAKLRVAGALRRVTVRDQDAPVEYVLDGTPLLLPMSHPLPLYRRDHPQYSSNVGRIAAAVAKGKPDFTFIDIGANVGDTLAIVRAHGDFPVLCIEGANEYLPLLRHNVVRFDDVEIEPCMIGIASRRFSAVAAASGTARLVSTGTGEVETTTLGDVLSRHPRFSQPGMIKIDTDGLDTTIVKAELAFLAQTQPVLFFEYDPHFFEANDSNGFAVFDELLRASYGPVLVYNNVGDLICATHLRERELLADLHEFYSGRGGRLYCDICAFPESLTEMSRTIRASEIVFFKKFRANGALHG